MQLEFELMSKAPKNAEIDHEKPKTELIEGSAEGTNTVDLEGTRGATDERVANISGGNLEGHDKNMADIEALHAGNEGQPAPGLGREDNGNTPRINKDGSKTWLPPGVAGALK